MKCLKIVILTLFLFKTFICESNFNKNIINGTAEDIIDYYMIEMQSKLFGFLRVILENNDTNNDSSEMDDLYDLIEGIDYNCFCFLIDIIEGRKFIYKIMKKLVHDGGIIQDSIGIEENCLDENGVYILFTGKNNITQLREDKGYMSKEDLFREALDFREEVCLFEECKFFYLPLFYYLSTFHKEAINNIFAFTNFTISGYIYNVNNTKEDVFNNTKDKEEIEREQEEDKYRHIVITIIQVLICIFALISIISWFIRKNNREIENKIPKSSEENDLLKNNSKKKENVDEEVENIFLSKEKMWEDLVWYKILSSFDFIKNLSLLNKKKEPLSDQTSLIVLSTIKILILFFILIGENAYLILKYVDNKMTSYYLIREISFINIKLGMNSYETYKVICGVIFGFKFINYYNKQGDFNFKKFLRFWTKPFPYIIIFLIIYFLFIYPSFIYARQLSPNYKNKYMSEIICSYSCQKHYYEIFNIFSIIEKYNSTDFYIGQYNGCTRPILFTFSEIICFYMILILAGINIYFKNNVSNIIFTIFFGFNFLFLCFTYFISREANDLVEEYTLSRLFGLSGSLAMPNFDGQENSLFGIFDGHGGSIISQFVACNIENILKNSPYYKKSKCERALIDSFILLDELLKNKDIDTFLKKIKIHQKNLNDVNLENAASIINKELIGNNVKNDPFKDYLFFCPSYSDNEINLKYQFPNLEQYLENQKEALEHNKINDVDELNQEYNNEKNSNVKKTENNEALKSKTANNIAFDKNGLMDKKDINDIGNSKTF